MIWVLSFLGDVFWVHACVKVVFQASRVGVLENVLHLVWRSRQSHMTGKRAPKGKPKKRQDEDKKASPDVA